jgi:hypothetical protein
LGEAKQFVEQAPSGFLFRTTAEGADGLVRFFGPGRLRIDPDITRTTGAPVTAHFTVWAALWATTESRSVWDEEYAHPPEARAAFRDFIASLLGVTHERAEELTDESDYVTVAEALDYPRSQVELARCRAHLPPDDPDRQWDIRLHVYPLKLNLPR